MAYDYTRANAAQTQKVLDETFHQPSGETVRPLEQEMAAHRETGPRNYGQATMGATYTQQTNQQKHARQQQQPTVNQRSLIQPDTPESHGLTRADTMFERADTKILY